MTSPSDVLINGLTYIENLIRVPKAIELTRQTWPRVLDYLTAAGFTVGQLSTFFSSYNTTNKLPSSYSSLYSALQTYGASLGITLSASSFDDVMLYEYIFWTNSDATANGIFDASQKSTDWSAISPTPTKADLMSQMKAFFTDLLQYYPYESSGSAGTYADFFENTSKSLTITAFLVRGSTLNSATNTDPDVLNLAYYDRIYASLFPSGNFATRLNQFYQDQIAKRGYFVPSLSLGDWATEMLEDYSRTLHGSPLVPTSLDSSNFDKTLILDRIFTLISSLVGTLQNIAAVQANRLVLLSNWQQAYTNSLSQLHTFLQTDGTFIANKTTGDNNARAYVRGQANDKVNASLRELLQSNRSIIGDTAKALQSNVNQTNDAVSQQANAAQAILQELTTLLGAIFR